MPALTAAGKTEILASVVWLIVQPSSQERIACFNVRTRHTPPRRHTAAVRKHPYAAVAGISSQSTDALGPGFPGGPFDDGNLRRHRGRAGFFYRPRRTGNLALDPFRGIGLRVPCSGVVRYPAFPVLYRHAGTDKSELHPQINPVLAERPPGGRDRAAGVCAASGDPRHACPGQPLW